MLSLSSLDFGWMRTASRRVGTWGFLAGLGIWGLGLHEAQAAAPTQKSSAQQAAPMPAALKQAWIAARQSDAGQEFAWRRQGSEQRGKQAAHISHPQGFWAAAHAGQMTVGQQPAGQSSQQVGMHLAAIQCAGAVRQVVDGNRPAPTVKHRRAEYALKSGVTEWYENGPMGLEQGFTISKPCPNSAPLTLEIALTGIKSLKQTGTIAEPALQITPQDPAQKPYSYSNLYAEDAQGKALQAEMSSSGEKILLTVNTTAAKFPIVVDPLIGVEPQKLAASGGLENDLFGAAIAISGDTAVIGAPGSLQSKGAAYVFVKSSDNKWTEKQKLEALDGKGSDVFGTSVAISGDTVVIGAELADLPAVMMGGTARSDAGAAYVFVKGNDNKWTEKQKLVATDGLKDDHFGISVAISGNTVVVGANEADLNASGSSAAGSAVANAGAAYVFVRAGDNLWEQKQKLITTDGAANDGFGKSVAISGDTMVIGAYEADLAALGSGAVNARVNAGAAYVFVLTGDTWTQKSKLVADDGAEGDFLGVSVAISGDTVVIGASGADLAVSGELVARANVGAAYVFAKSSDNNWIQQQKLAASDGAKDDSFGYSVTTTGDTAVIGASYAGLAASGATAGGNQIKQAGAAYVFARSGTTWTQQSKLVASDGKEDDYFAYSVATTGNTVLMGAFWADLPAVGAGSSLRQNAGAAYSFNLIKTGGDACAQGSECQNGLCVDGVCCDTACGGGDSSDCMACSVAKGAAQNGVCGPVVKSAALVCRASTGESDAAELCDGAALTCPEDAPPTNPSAESSSGCRCQVGTQSVLSFGAWLVPAALLLLTLRRRPRAS